MKVAIIGSGISGMGAALALKDICEVSLFEQDVRFGGHANTQQVLVEGVQAQVDTGFIVYNTQNYPNLVGLFEYLDVPTKWSDMSFGVSLRHGNQEYAFDSLDKIFAQRRNIFSKGFLSFLAEINRFNKTAPEQLAAGALDRLSLAQWVEREGFSERFRDRFILPMGGAIWSTPVSDMLNFPARNFVSFFKNHDLMTGLKSAQRWRTVDGGSREYVTRLIAKLGPLAQKNRRVVSVDRRTGKPRVKFEDGSEHSFDHVIMATHAPATAKLLDDQSEFERSILGRFKVSKNKAVLHGDARLMPIRKKVWSSWNFLTGLENDAARPTAVTYWMNRLQSLPNHTPLFLSLNPLHDPDPQRVYGTYEYDHPVFDQAAFEAQNQMDHMQGQGGIWYAGAWMGFGFHEDGLRAGLRVAHALGASPSWSRDCPPIERHLEAAE